MRDIIKTNYFEEPGVHKGVSLRNLNVHSDMRQMGNSKPQVDNRTINVESHAIRSAGKLSQIFGIPAGDLNRSLANSTSHDHMIDVQR